MWISQSFGKLLQLTVECGREGGGIDTLALVVQGILISFCPSFHVSLQGTETWNEAILDFLISWLHLVCVSPSQQECLTDVCVLASACTCS